MSHGFINGPQQPAPPSKVKVILFAGEWKARNNVGLTKSFQGQRKIFLSLVSVDGQEHERIVVGCRIRSGFFRFRNFPVELSDVERRIEHFRNDPQAGEGVVEHSG